MHRVQWFSSFYISLDNLITGGCLAPSAWDSHTRPAVHTCFDLMVCLYITWYRTGWTWNESPVKSAHRILRHKKWLPDEHCLATVAWRDVQKHPVSRVGDLFTEVLMHVEDTIFVSFYLICFTCSSVLQRQFCGHFCALSSLAGVVLSCLAGMVVSCPAWLARLCSVLSG